MLQLLENVLTASFHGSIVIASVLLLRLALKKAPRKYICWLWLLAGLRLLMPIEIKSDLSLQPDVDAMMEVPFAQPVFAEPAAEPEYIYEEPIWEEIPEVQPYVPAETENVVVWEPTQTTRQEAPAAEETTPAPDPKTIAAYVWLAGTCCFALYLISSYLGLKRKVREAICIEPGIWECDRIETAFILGFIRPQIYLPMGMSRENRCHILAHERTHLEKGDHWIKMIGFVALSLHWFNPLVWAAYILLCKDIEMACDERVVQFMKLDERKSYSAALLSCSTNHVHFASPVAFGEVSVKERIMTVLNYKKPGFWVSLISLAAIAFVAVCLVTSPTEEAEPSEELEIVDTMKATESTAQNAVTVKTVDELLAAIGSDVEIVMEAGTYNLCEASDYGQEETNSKYYSWTEVSDGYRLDLKDVENLTIRGSGMHVTVLETDPRYADVLALEDCANVVMADFTAGHTVERGECSGGVISLNECESMDMTRLGLYGCGVIGLVTVQCEDITLTESDVYDCSSAAMVLGDTNNVAVSNCRFYRIGSERYGGFTFFQASGSNGVSISNCVMSDSTLAYMLCAFNSPVELKNNLISNNRFTDAALQIQGQITDVETMEIQSANVIMTENRFEGNTVRSWYTDYRDGYAQDASGKEITEEDFGELYGTEPVEPEQPRLEIHVSTVDEFIAAIGPDKEIVLDGPLYDFSTATGYGTSSGDYYFWQNDFDGPGLVITNVNNLTIRSNDGDREAHILEAVPRYADVLTFNACTNITLSGFTAGHTREPGSCSGGVLEFRDSDGILVDNCGLFGCGILGIQTEDCSGLTVKNCDIYECSQGGIKLWSTSDVTIENTTFRDIGGDSIMRFNSCKNVRVDGETLIDEYTKSLSVVADDQKDRIALDALLADFIYYYRINDAKSMAAYLAGSYEGDGKTYAEGDTHAIPMWLESTQEQVDAIARDGSFTFEIGMRDQVETYAAEDVSEVGVFYLCVTVIRENGEYKVSDYYRK